MRLTVQESALGLVMELVLGLASELATVMELALGLALVMGKARVKQRRVVLWRLACKQRACSRLCQYFDCLR